MFFLIRMAFWLTVVLVLLPSGGSQPVQKTPSFSAADAVSAASATIADMRHFCERQRDVCAVGSQAAVAIGQRAQAGAKMLYELISEQLAPTTTGSVTGSDRSPPARPSQHTLTPRDLAPAWRGPQAG
jgi:hypothetical protein